MRKQNNKEDTFYEDIKYDTKLQFTSSLDSSSTVCEDKLNELRESNDIKAMLTNSHLRDFLKQVNDAKYPHNAMKLAMKEPLFLEFADKCLQIVDK
jgi:hypothetical protein